MDYIPIGFRDIYIQKFWNMTSSYLQKWACSQILAFLAAFIDTQKVKRIFEMPK